MSNVAPKSVPNDAPAAAPAPPVGTASAPPVWTFLLGLSLVAGLAEMAFIIVNVSALPVYLEFGLGLPKLVGYSLGAFYLAEAIGNSPMGALGDRFGRRRLMVTGALISVGTCLGTAFLRVPEGGGPLAWLGIGLLIALRVLDGLGAAALWPALFASVSDRVEPRRQAQAMSALNITYFVGIALGPFVGGWVNDTFGGTLGKTDAARYTPSFFVAAGCFAVAALVAYFVAPRREETHQTSAADHYKDVLGEAGPAAAHDVHGGEALSLAGIKRALRLLPALMAVGFLTFFAIGLIAPYIKLFAIKRYLDAVPETQQETTFGLLLLYPALFIAAIAVPLGRLTDRWGTTRSIRGGLALCALAFWSVLATRQQWGLVALGGLIGIGFVLAFPAYMAYIADAAGPHARGGVIGAARTTQGLGAMLGTVLSGPIYQMDVRHLILFNTAAVLLSAATALSLVYVREQRGGAHPGAGDAATTDAVTATPAAPPP